MDKVKVQEVRRSEDRFLGSDVFEAQRRQFSRANGTGTHYEPGREIPVYHSCDVLVVGGGPAGTAAAWAAAKAGADVVLLERYNHLGGLSTGGLVIWIDRMTDWNGRQVIRGFASDVLDRMPEAGLSGPRPEDWGSRDPQKASYWGQRTAAFHGTVCWSPTLDPERLKLISQEMLIEAGVRIVFHSWAAMPIVSDGAVRGVVFESKAGRQALRAKVVVDATGDGDVFSRAGAQFETDIEQGDVHHSANTAFMLGGVDMDRWLAFRGNDPAQYAEFASLGRERLGFFQPPYVSWRNDIALFLGPRQSGLSALDVDDQTELEIRSHRFMKSHCDFFVENAPGFENAYMLQSAPQLGVRHTRRLAGTGKVLRGQWADGVALPDEIGVSPSVSLKYPVISVPYGALVPRQLDGLLVGGRHISCDANSHGFMREIPQCWLTGQAAGAAAALAVSARVEPRAVDIRSLRSELARQGVFLQDDAATDATQAPAASV
ncbi:FAD-dependent oxidoreductase [Altererythrobacter sp. B11]|uniref:FAD-dependent oxidoreductase n=1 Tax=Altererythrobacter sp. B11 TaxID=2060312 RepID=UPI000DC71202|nr:FAD-dependent oxidoreductase [Altererythrobacter sp. B11]BBC73378.1 FAD-dependent oxidoreductase [Altererythrobacter sp. B11]